MKKPIKRFLLIILILILLLVIILAGLFIFRNQIATLIIEKSGSAVAGAKVEVDNLYMKPFKLHISWERFQVTNKNDTWRNLFETAKCEFSLAFKPLWDRKVIIEKMKMETVQFDTKRSSDGKLPIKKKKPKKPSKLLLAIKKNLEREKQQIPVFNPKFLKTKIDVDSLMQVLNFQTPAKADSLKKLAEDRYNYWENTLKDNNYEAEIKSIETDIKAIDLDKMDTLEDFERNFTLAKKTYDSSNKLYKDFKQDKEQLESDLDKLNQLKKDIPVWITEDYNNALSLAKLPDVSVHNVALMLFGDKIADGIIKVMDYIEQSRELSKVEKKDKPRKEKMPYLPSFWIKEITLSAITKDEMFLSGKVFDISTDQKKTSKPMKIVLKGEREKTGKLNLGAIFDYRTDNSKETINLEISEVPIRNMKMTNFDLLPTKLKRGDAALSSNINISEDIILVNIDFAADNIQFDYTSQPDMDENLVRISRSITEAIDKITFEADITQSEDNFRLKLNSNLDELIASQLRKVVSDEIARAKNEIKKRVQKELDKYRAEVEEYIAGKNQELQKELNKINKEINKQLKEVENKKKEVENRIDAEKKKIEKQAEDKLKEEVDELLDKLKF
jgi:uncharacterized protein (TIGR03545 family)